MIPNHSKAQTAKNLASHHFAFLRQPRLTQDHYAKEMSDLNSHGRQAMDILKQKLANESANQDTAINTQDADKTGGQRIDPPCPTMPVMNPISSAVQAPSPNSKEATGSGELTISQVVQHDAPVSDTNGGNGLCESSSASQPQEGHQDDNILSGLMGALTIIPSAFADDNVGRDIFSNDHLSSEIVPLEDPAEALALSQSTVPVEIRNQRSRQLNLLTCGPKQCPTAAAALHPDNFPFVEGARIAQATPAYGVIRLRDIPEGTRRSEILALMGRNSRVLNDVQEPVHIIIERVNAATREAFVEFMTERAAEDVIERFDQVKRDGHAPRLGDHPVRYELSSQAALMKALFPQARGVQWVGATPHIIPANQVQFSWERFKGFITPEEMIVLAKHAESNKSWNCPQRPYECMISIMRKMPWYMTEHITIFQRQCVYDAIIRLIQSLQKQMRFRNNAYLLNEQLLERLWVSAMLCHGFTVTMKDNIAFCVDLSAERMRDFNMPRFPERWVHTHTLVPKPGTPIDVLEWYIAIIRETTTREVEQLQPNEQRELSRQVGRTSLYWGYYWKVLRLDDLVGPTIDNMSLAEMARREFHVLTGILSHAFGGQQASLQQQQQQQQQQQLLGLLAPGHQIDFSQQQLIDPFQQQQVDDSQQFGPGGR